jgi:hypothetical protein
MTAPAWLAATSGYPALAGQVNQFLASHAVTYVYTGALQANQGTAGSGSVASDGTWIAQSFTAASGQTTAGYVTVTAAVTGSPAPWTVSLEADNGSGAPSGTVLASAAAPKEFMSGTAAAVTVMLPYSGLTPSARYWIAAAAAGDASDYYAWSKSNQASGASTAPDGVTWTAQSYGLLYQVFDGTPVQPLAGTWEDSGARWTVLSYTSGQLTRIREYTAGQAANGYAVSARTLSYSGSALTGVA